MKKAFLAFDLGTSGVKCSVFDTDANPIASRYGEYATYFPEKGFGEQKPQEWIQAIAAALADMKAALSEITICAIGVSGHSLGVIPVDETGQLLCECTPIWSDCRAEKEAAAFFEKTDYDTWYRITGNGFSPYLYTVFKMMWYKTHLPKVYEKAVAFIGSKDYINLYLTGEIATDRSYASGSGIFDLKRGEYREEYARLAQVDLNKFPKVLPSHTVMGCVTEAASKALGIPQGIPVVAGGVDNACMALGAGCFEEGDSYASLGSSAWATVCSADPMTEERNGGFTFAHCVEGMFIPSVGIYSSGSALDWVMKRFFPDLTGGDRYEKLEVLSRSSETGAHGLFFNPCLAGGASIDPSPNTNGCLFNLTLAHERADIARAAMEGIAIHLFAAAEPMVRQNRLKEPLLLVGGTAKSETMRQIYADVFGIKTCVSQVQQAAASLGAAALAAVGCGEWDSFSPLKRLFETVTEYVPNAESHTHYERMFPLWKKIRLASAQIGDDLADLEKR